MASEEENEEILLPIDIYYNLIPIDDNDHCRHFFDVENEFMPPPIYSELKLFRQFRRLCIFSIEANVQRDNSDAFISYLAMTYVDRFASTCDIPSVIQNSSARNIHLFLTCCLSIASKMRNDNFKIAGLLEPPNPGDSYTTEEAFKMELAICKGLQWKMRSITPFCFVDYFINILHSKSAIHPSIPRRSIHEIIIRSQGVVKLIKYKPSTVAASAVLVFARWLHPNREDMLDFILSTGRVEKDSLEEAINLIKEIYVPSNEDPIPSEAASDSSSQTSRAVDHIPRDQPMNFQLSWIPLASKTPDVEGGVDRQRAFSCYFSFFRHY